MNLLLANHVALPVVFNGSSLCVFFCIVSSLPTSLPPSLLLYLLFLVYGKQMKNLGQKAVSVCSLKRTISARGECCSSCAAEHARKRGNGTLSPGTKGSARRGGDLGAKRATLSFFSPPPSLYLPEHSQSHNL
ncbi:hypothetical protein GOODEAATRI_005111 [Goodea atripinnis]|uniref:Uncharacterized protein n=1 Tax=Goodea atripinnis TaxID=208336 RepID=A0ABV0NHL3_9TELE